MAQVLIEGQAGRPALFWAEQLDAIDGERGKVSHMGHFLDSKRKDHANADGKMTDAEKVAFLKKFEADLIPPADVAPSKRGASNAGYHYLGCAKTFALMGKAFAKANLSMLQK